MRTSLTIGVAVAYLAFAATAVQIQDCASETEQELYAVSCDFVVESLYDIEMAKISHPKNVDDPIKEKLDEPLDDEPENGFEYAKGIRSKKYGTSVPYYPFSPYNKDAALSAEVEGRRSMCKSLLLLPQTRRRCCTLLEVLCSGEEKPNGRLDRLINGLSAKVESMFKKLINRA